MAKNRNSKKSKRNSSDAMNEDQPNTAQAMDTSESFAPKSSHRAISRKLKKGIQMKRTKNVRKMKAIAKAVSMNERNDERLLKNDSKTQRIQSAKKLYD